MLINTRDCT